MVIFLWKMTIRVQISTIQDKINYFLLERDILKSDILIGYHN